MPDTIIGTISVCQDCLHAHANGEFDPDRPADLPEPLSAIEDGYSVTSGGDRHHDDCEWDNGGDCYCDALGFSTSACDGCGDWHHGDRYQMTLWKDAA